MENILIIGGAGYIGSHQVESLIEENFNVIVLDNLTTGFQKAVDKRAKFIKGDVRDKKLLLNILKHYNITSVMNFAAFSNVSESLKDPLKYFNNNVYGMQILLEAMTECNVKYLVFSSSASVYGNSYNKKINENCKTAPTDPYGESKLMIEQMVKWVSEASGIKYIAIRSFNIAGSSKTIGEAHNPETHLIPNVISHLLNDNQPIEVYGNSYPTHDGTCIRDYIHVKDLTQAYLQSLYYLQTIERSGIYNVGSGFGYSVLDIIKETSNFIKKDMNYTFAPPREGDPAVLIADNSKLTKNILWKPRHSNLQEIIRSAYLWQKNNPDKYK